jgi:hypothetical protein
MAFDYTDFLLLQAMKRLKKWPARRNASYENWVGKEKALYQMAACMKVATKVWGVRDIDNFADGFFLKQHRCHTVALPVSVTMHGIRYASSMP